MWIFASDRRGLVKAWHFSLALSTLSSALGPDKFFQRPLTWQHTPIGKCFITAPFSQSPVARSQVSTTHCPSSSKGTVPGPEGAMSALHMPAEVRPISIWKSISGSTESSRHSWHNLPPTHCSAGIKVFLCITPEESIRRNKRNGFAEIYGDFLMEKVENRRKCKG